MNASDEKRYTYKCLSCGRVFPIKTDGRDIIDCPVCRGYMYRSLKSGNDQK